MKFQTIRGTRDFLPEDMVKREYIINTLKKVFEKYGFEPLETPAIEYEETLTKKYGEEERLIWNFKDKGGRKVALKYDLTVPMCRVIGMNPRLLKPFKRYQIQPVWRYEKPQKGRYREFYQCDIDSVGSYKMEADVEIVAMINDIMVLLGFKKFKTKINNREILDSISKVCGVKESQKIEVTRAIDKLDKIGINGVEKELKQRGIDKKVSEKILKTLKLSGTNEEKLEKMKNYDGTEKLKKFYNKILEYGVKEKDIEIDPFMVRGLDYYTSLVFETVVEEPRIGSLTGGGRYDKLVEKLSGIDTPGTGTTIGLERLYDVMNELNLWPKNLKTSTQIFIATINEKFSKKAVEIAQQLRKKDINVETDIMGRNFKKQINYASKKGIPFMLIIGEKEIKENKFTLKDLKTGKEQTMSLEKIKKGIAK